MFIVVFLRLVVSSASFAETSPLDLKIHWALAGGIHGWAGGLYELCCWGPNSLIAFASSKSMSALQELAMIESLANKSSTRLML